MVVRCVRVALAVCCDSLLSFLCLLWVGAVVERLATRVAATLWHLIDVFRMVVTALPLVPVAG